MKTWYVLFWCNHILQRSVQVYVVLMQVTAGERGHNCSWPSWGLQEEWRNLRCYQILMSCHTIGILLQMLYAVIHNFQTLKCLLATLLCMFLCAKLMHILSLKVLNRFQCTLSVTYLQVNTCVKWKTVWRGNAFRSLGTLLHASFTIICLYAGVMCRAIEN